MEQSCSNCRYCHQGHCYRYPPKLRYDGTILRPAVRETDFCGEWKPLTTEQKREARAKEYREAEQEHEARLGRLGLMFGAISGCALQADYIIAGQAVREALESGEQRDWKNPDSGNAGSITPARTWQREDTSACCREFQATVTIRGEQFDGYGTVCRQPDGSWGFETLSKPKRPCRPGRRRPSRPLAAPAQN